MTEIEERRATPDPAPTTTDDAPTTERHPDSTVDRAERERDCLTYLDATLGQTRGWLAAFIGFDGHMVPTADGGESYKFGRHEQRFYEWPAQRETAARDLIAESDLADVYVAPYTMRRKKRDPRGAVELSNWHGDIDHNRVTVADVQDAGMWATYSGGDGHMHLYGRLSKPVALNQHRHLCELTRDKFDGDHKLNPNDLLRPAGTMSHKGRARGGQSTVVTFVVRPEDAPRLAAWDAAKRLGGNMVAAVDALSDTTAAQHNTHTPAAVAAEQFNIKLWPGVQKAVATETGDRSSDLARIVEAVSFAGLTMGNAVHAVQQNPGASACYSEHLSRSAPIDDVAVLWAKFRPEHEAKRSAWRAENTDESAVEADDGDADPMDISALPTAVAGEMETRGYLSDVEQSIQFAREYLRGRFAYCKPLGGWLKYGAGVWTATTDNEIKKLAKRHARRVVAQGVKNHQSVNELRPFMARKAERAIRAVESLARGEVEVTPEQFDNLPDHICVANGVVDLRDGSLRRHRAADYFTKRTAVTYDPHARHADWDAALSAVEPEVASYLQVRFGQALTGYQADDDAVAVARGGGSNAKSTVFTGVMKAAGDYAVLVPEKVLVGNPHDHSCEQMVLRGARIGLVDETAEGRHVNVQRLKTLLGSTAMTARWIASNPVTWSPTHSLFVCTNHQMRVTESDHGTWRRLLEIPFPYKYLRPHETPSLPHERAGDPGLRSRIAAGQDGQHEAILAWLVAGAVRWYASDRTMPEPPAAVRAATDAWRCESDPLGDFITNELEAHPDGCVAQRDLHAVFTASLGPAARDWSEATFSDRFRAHPKVEAAGAVKKPGQRVCNVPLTRPANPFATPPQLPKQAVVWFGFRFVDHNQPYR